MAIGEFAPNKFVFEECEGYAEPDKRDEVNDGEKV